MLLGLQTKLKYFITLCVFFLSSCSSTWQSSSVVSSANGQKKASVVRATSTPRGSLNGDEVFLILYRKSGFIGSATAWPVQYNGYKIGSLKNGAFIAIKTNAGQKTLLPESHLGVYSEGVEAFNFNAQAGQTYYLLHGTDSIYSAKLNFRIVPSNHASSEIAKYSLVTVKNEYKPSKSANGQYISKIYGRAFIERGIKTYPAKPGTPLQAGDKVNVEIGSQAELMLHGGLIKVTEYTSYQIPEKITASQKKEILTPPGLPSRAWSKIKQLLKGDRFEIKTPTAVAGVRG